MNTGFLRLLRLLRLPRVPGVSRAYNRLTVQRKGTTMMTRWLRQPWVSVITLDAVVYIAVLLVVLIAAGIWRVLGL